tara:strand:+ start:526 stop:885 length:360 start_codon:yes stop_codon:yes gene_type:complete
MNIYYVWVPEVINDDKEESPCYICGHMIYKSISVRIPSIHPDFDGLDLYIHAGECEKKHNFYERIVAHTTQIKCKIADIVWMIEVEWYGCDDRYFSKKITALVAARDNLLDILTEVGAW